jgi:hypothetical protein
MATIEEKIQALEEEIQAYTNMLLNQSGYRSIQGAGNEGAKTDFTDPIKKKELRQESRDRLSMLRLQKEQGYKS